MNLESIKANGISWYEPAKSIIPHLTTQIGIFKMRHPEKNIFEKFGDGEYFSGRRFNDNGDVAIRIGGAIVRQAQEEYIYSNMGRNSMTSEETLPLLEGIISAWFDTLSASEIDMLIVDGLKCCAETDHWYEFEKQWD
jgi:hypothetical protein